MRNLPLNTYHKPGVFELKFFGVTVAYFVGWRAWRDGPARNIRAGLYFKTAEEATKWRDDMEARRQIDNGREHNQIA